MLLTASPVQDHYGFTGGGSYCCSLCSDYWCSKTEKEKDVGSSISTRTLRYFQFPSMHHTVLFVFVGDDCLIPQTLMFTVLFN
jgi:hypothetical protein